MEELLEHVDSDDSEDSTELSLSSPVVGGETVGLRGTGNCNFLLIPLSAFSIFLERLTDPEADIRVMVMFRFSYLNFVLSPRITIKMKLSENGKSLTFIYFSGKITLDSRTHMIVGNVFTTKIITRIIKVWLMDINILNTTYETLINFFISFSGELWWFNENIIFT